MIKSARRLRRLMAGAAALLTLGPLAACSTATTGSTSGAASPTESKQLVIGSMLWNASVPFYSNFIKGQQEQAAKLGIKLVMVDGKGDLGTEVAGIGQLVTQQVDAILVTASDAAGIAPAVKKAVAAGIPVFAVNNRVDDAAGAITFIGADDVMFGEQQAKLLVEAVGEDAKVGYLVGALGTSAQLLREEGFKKALAAHPGIKLVDTQTDNWDAAKALGIVQDWMNKYPAGSLDAIVAQGPEAANAAKYVSQNGRTDLKIIVGDYPVEVRSGIKDGYIFGTIDQDPKPQGTQSVQAAYDWLTGAQDKVKRPNMYLDLPIVTKSNVDQFAAAWGE